jgi:hypothetical protein
MVQEAENLLGKHEALSSIPSAANIWNSNGGAQTFVSNRFEFKFLSQPHISNITLVHLFKLPEVPFSPLWVNVMNKR